MGRVRDILAIEKLLPSTQVANLARREGAVSNPRKKGPIRSRNPAPLLGVENRLDSKAKTSSSHWTVNGIQPFKYGLPSLFTLKIPLLVPRKVRRWYKWTQCVQWRVVVGHWFQSRVHISVWEVLLPVIKSVKLHTSMLAVCRFLKLWRLQVRLTECFAGCHIPLPAIPDSIFEYLDIIVQANPQFTWDSILKQYCHECCTESIFVDSLGI